MRVRKRCGLVVMNMNMDDIFSQFGDIFGGGGSPFESFFGGDQAAEEGVSEKVRTFASNLNCHLDEIANGVEKKIKVNRLDAG